LGTKHLHRSYSQAPETNPIGAWSGAHPGEHYLNRITRAFSQVSSGERKGFIPFITAGDPDLETTGALLVELAAAGATAIELGVPFSDPMADGPVIQRASERALKHGFGLGDILQTVSAAQHEMNGVPVVLFSYFNPLLQFGLGRLCREASESGIDAILVTDLIPEEAADFSVAVRDHGMEMIFLVAPTSSDERLRMVSERAGGFIYAVSRAGVTGARADLSQQAELLVERVRRFSDLPVAVGFGISTAEQVSDTLRYADAAVVGSAIVSLIETLDGSPNLVPEVGRFCRELLSGGRLPNRF
jgi:tryptophan synthase alpha chain